MVALGLEHKDVLFRLPLYSQSNKLSHQLRARKSEELLEVKTKHLSWGSKRVFGNRVTFLGSFKGPFECGGDKLKAIVSEEMCVCQQETDDDESSLTWAMANLFVEGRKRDSGLKMARRSKKDTTSPSG